MKAVRNILFVTGLQVNALNADHTPTFTQVSSWKVVCFVDNALHVDEGVDSDARQRFRALACGTCGRGPKTWFTNLFRDFTAMFAP